VHGTFERERSGNSIDGFLPPTILPSMSRPESTIFATICAAALALGNEVFLPRVTGNPEECITYGREAPCRRAGSSAR